MVSRIRSRSDSDSEDDRMAERRPLLPTDGPARPSSPPPSCPPSPPNAEPLVGKGESTPLVSKAETWRSILCSAQTLHIALVGTAYLVLNIGLNFYNKYVLGTKENQLNLNSIAIFYTLCHQLMGMVVYGLMLFFIPSMRSYPQHLPVGVIWRRYWPWLLGLGFFFSTSIVTNNKSLGLVSLTLNSIIKSIMPVPTAALAYFLNNYRPTMWVVASLVVLTVGVLLACLGGDESKSKDPDKSKEALGYALIIYSLFATTIRPVIAGRIFDAAKRDSDGATISAITLSFFDAVLSVVILLPASLGLEWDQIKLLFGEKSWAWGAILLASGMAGAYNYSAFAVVKLTSAVTFVVLGQFKQIVLIDGASLQEGYSAPITWIGSTLVLAGGMWYAQLKLQEKKKPPPALPPPPPAAAADVEQAKAAGDKSPREM